MTAGPYSIGSTHWPGLSKMIEECGEVQQVAGKLLGTGGEAKHWDGSDLRSRLQEELGDLMAAIEFVMTRNDLDCMAIASRAARKVQLFEKWHRDALGESSEAGAERFQRHLDTVNGCRSASDGDCDWRDCPQLRDGEPKKSGRHCPLDRAGQIKPADADTIVCPKCANESLGWNGTKWLCSTADCGNATVQPPETIKLARADSAAAKIQAKFPECSRAGCTSKARRLPLGLMVGFCEEHAPKGQVTNPAPWLAALDEAEWLCGVGGGS